MKVNIFRRYGKRIHEENAGRASLPIWRLNILIWWNFEIKMLCTNLHSTIHDVPKFKFDMTLSLAKILKWLSTASCKKAGLTMCVSINLLRQQDFYMNLQWNARTHDSYDQNAHNFKKIGTYTNNYYEKNDMTILMLSVTTFINPIRTILVK